MISMNNTVCRNFEYKEKADGALELTRLNCEKCEFNNNCAVKTAILKDHIVSMEFVNTKGAKDGNNG